MRAYRLVMSRWVVAVFLLVLLGGCHYRGILPREEGLHPRLTPFTYLEEGRLIAFAVDTEAARQREKDLLIPFGIGVTNLGLKSLSLSRESFTLIDDAGRRYGMVSLQEMRAAVVAPDFDVKVSRDFFGIWKTRNRPWPRVASSFFPLARSRRLVQDRVQLHRHAWMSDLVYFSHPEGRLVGRVYEMWIDAPELPEPTFVKFRIK
ncbi:MAG: hypothetical protein Q9Q40_01880 [Acidobacteriota bacterium]|nr:hypothetical protein [Acidobacteriota bacterium]